MLRAEGRSVGREQERARLERALDQLDAGRAAAKRAASEAIAIVGEPGIGKSRLLAEAAELARERGMLVFAGRAAEFEQELPFGAVTDALDPYLGSLNPRFLHGLHPEQLRELGAVFPALDGLTDVEVSPLQPERYRAHHAVRALLELLARERPCVLILDDMHWADEASLELVAHLLRRPPQAPALMLLAFRPPQAPPRLIAPIERAEREGSCERIEVSPLTREEADGLLGPGIDRESRDRLYRAAGGNPFYLEQLARTPLRIAEVADVPRAVRESIAGEVASLPARAQAVLRGASVVGDPFTPALAAAAADVEHAEALEALDQMVSLDLVRSTESPLDLRFRHPIVRAALYESTPPAARVAAHARVAAALAARGSSPVVLAPHIERSSDVGDLDAVAALTAAGHACAPRAPAAAARWFAAALRLLPEEQSQRRPELLVPLARALGSSGQLEASREALQEVLRLLPPELGAIRGQVIAFMSLISHLLGRHGEARENLIAALGERGDDPASPEAAALEAELAADCFFLGEWTQMNTWAARASGLADAAGDPRTQATATALLALSCYELGRPVEAREHVAEAKAIIDGLSDDELALRIDACHWLGWCEHLLDHYDDSVRHMERGVAISRRTGQGHVLAPMTIGLVIANTWQGELERAWAHAEEAVEIAHLSGSDQLMAWAQTMRCWVAGRRGDLELAVAAGEEALRVSERVIRGPYTVVASCWLADALIERGAPQRAVDVLLAAIDGPELPGVEPAFRSCIYEVLTRGELARDRVERAGDWAARAADAVRGLGLPGRESFALRALAEVELASGRPAAAAELALAAAEKAGASYRVDSARSRLLAGRSFAAAGDRRRALAELRRARRALDECGARRYREQAVRELRRLGEHVGAGGVRGAGDSGLAGLSAREREVADLVCDRLTNREIAERLVISEKTVERHLARIFQKLDVHSRVEVARTVERGLTRASYPGDGRSSTATSAPTASGSSS